MEEYDVVIIGAGASGINAAYKVQTEMPGARFTVLESRDTIGGTWNFFKYPGLRSDSYLTGFGFRWRPWSEEKEIADGPMIQKYLEDSVAWAGIDQHIEFQHRVTGTHWSTPESKWTVEVDVDGGRSKKTLKSTFLFTCSGYYDYQTPLQAAIPGISSFQGEVVHPQFWPADLDYANKRVVIIGSGATTITILPVLARTAAHVTMLQRSPGYVMPLPSAPGHIFALRRWLPKRIADNINFWKDVLIQSLIRFLCLAFPNFARRLFIKRMAKQLEGSGIPVDPHFTPRYDPWAQRLCVCPDGDFYDALRQPNTDVVTDHIRTVTASGIVTTSGKTIDADIIVTATGLRILILGGVDVTVDGQRVNIGERFAWRNFMLEGVPNMAMVIGYTNMSWTLGSDSCLRLMMRVIKHMKSLGATAVKPVVENRESLVAEPIISMKSTYFLVAHDRLPRKAGVDPWDERKGYIPESFLAWFGSIKTLTKGLEFTVPGRVNGKAD
ncbi:FAD/NAD(P)-binding domain-containing protein [Cryphonectria parasitica EP155]|uniref:FAD/NAD(P)-binding domain-containing protein n=1 Tax=Cryphonectria parasitica (strain ATCC 38755 / EP155) TaxID=660469 RepID=A0A9P5CPS9_CRYP1|nr:FAD/NAD(P)-binding domain-containing protein [Cryphonectria parasitica EP155]KAF3766488.1 FAD/NAD(P)-binding domain-containing protein [Cryphonectria parasitica EP155]